MDGTVGCESDPEKTDRHEDTAGLTHDESEFRPDGTVLLDFLECEPTQTRQFIDRGGGGVWYVPYQFQNGCDSVAVIKPTPSPRKLNPENSSVNPWRPKIMGNACKERYRTPMTRAVLRGGFL